MGDVLPAVVGGYFPAAVAFGALARLLHLPWILAVLLSAVVYSGALQSAVLGLWAVGADVPTMVGVGVLVNLRHVFYGPHLERLHPEWSDRARWAIAPLLTDEVYAAAVAHPEWPARRLFALAAAAWATWQAGTWVGLGLGALVPAGWTAVLALALPALFLTLVLPRLRDGATAAGVAAAALLAAVVRWRGAPPSLLVVPILAGTSLSFWLAERRRRPAPGLGEGRG
ncbi:MAG: AzlC family ABC transporter permease [Actinomycetia bacterium]|nr:AzlC family ABC transporter permease [Actinomycetes bacterium]